MNYLMYYVLIVYFGLTMAFSLAACQSATHDESYDDTYDFVYDKLDRQDILQAKHHSYSERLARAREIWRISSQESSDARSLRKERREIAKMRTCINKIVKSTLEKRGLAPEKVDLKMTLSFRGRNKPGK